MMYIASYGTHAGDDDETRAGGLEQRMPSMIGAHRSERISDVPGRGDER